MEIIGEIAFSLGLVALGFVIGSVVFAVVRTVRWVLLRTERVTVVTDPLGGQWSVGIPLAPARIRFKLSTKAFQMSKLDQQRRGREGTSHDGVTSTEFAHPSALVSNTQEFAPVVGFLMLAFVVMAAAIFLVELVAVVVIAAVVAGMRMLWGRWRCEVLAADGQRSSVAAGSLRAARVKCAQMVESIAAGTGVNAFLS